MKDGRLGKHKGYRWTKEAAAAAGGWWTTAQTHGLDLRNNSIGFLRFVLAGLVIFAHSFVISGRFGPEPLHRLGAREDLGWVAVDAFFILSGFLIVASFLRLRSTGRFLWHRFLRIMPGFWACTLVTALAVLPAVYWLRHGELASFFSSENSVWHYITSNLYLHPRQQRVVVADMFLESAKPWVNGSIWTLVWEVACYVGVAILGMVGLLRERRWLVTAAFALAYVGYVTASLLDLDQIVGVADATRVLGLACHFAAGMTAYFWMPRLRWSALLAATSLAAFVAAAAADLLFVVSPLALSYLLWYGAARLPLTGFDRRVDLSYGLYIYGAPIQQSLLYLGIATGSVWTFFGVSMAVTAALAFASWKLVERPALALKGMRLPWRRPNVTTPPADVDHPIQSPAVN